MGIRLEGKYMDIIRVRRAKRVQILVRDLDVEQLVTVQVKEA